MKNTKKIDYEHIMETRIKYGKYCLVNNLLGVCLASTLGMQFVILAIIVPPMDKDFKMSRLQKIMIA